MKNKFNVGCVSSPPIMIDNCIHVLYVTESISRQRQITTMIPQLDTIQISMLSTRQSDPKICFVFHFNFPAYYPI